MKEIWDLYNKDRIKIGQTMVRGDEFEEDTFHLVIHVCIFNSKGEMLIQQRQPFKKGWSNLWDVTVGGSAVLGDTSQKAAEREVLEEIGYKISLENIRPAFTLNFDRGFDDFYIVEREIDITKLKLQYEEVQRVKWATLNEILEMSNSKEFIPYHKSLIRMLFELHSYEDNYVK
ncbi:NUDIX domain-containing protein [uncultured Clostridium sp.]|uniref:NUDIX hydrolase n=1 Tax=uncultured Clostridium sp. TaxID=59620 RepID=UPI00262A7590|nr:NUDIX domain-containing protein [uncultured Clostridium sp.]